MSVVINNPSIEDRGTVELIGIAHIYEHSSSYDLNMSQEDFDDTYEVIDCVLRNRGYEYNDKWLTKDEETWTVYQHKHRAKNTVILYDGDNIEMALEALEKG